MSPITKNSVVCYKGGGYDGCFWEYNFAYIDGEGNFHDIFSSGYKGAKNIEELLDRITTRPEGYSVYEMGDFNDRQLLASSESVVNVLRIGHFFKDHPEFEVSLSAQCDLCGKRVDVVDCHPEGFHGCGGMEIVADDIICDNCYSSHTCWDCGDFDRDPLVGEFTKEDGTAIELRGSVCQHCLERYKSGEKVI